jgi:hypothetical protein
MIRKSSLKADGDAGGAFGRNWAHFWLVEGIKGERGAGR